MIRLRAALPLTVLSAALYAAAFPPLAWRWCAWFALVPLLIALRRATLPRAIALGTLWGVLAAEGVGTWFATGVARYYDRAPAIGVLFIAAVALLLAAPFFAAFAAAYAAFTRHRRLYPDALLVATAWIACELARARFLVGNPWALLGYSQIGELRLMQIADVAGVYGISFAIAAVNGALARCLDGSTTICAKIRELAVAAGALAVILAYGEHALRAAPAVGDPLEVAVVQADTDLGTQWRPELYGAHLDTYVKLSRDALTRSPAALVVWPEAAVTFFLEDEPSYRAAIAAVLRGSGARLVTGGPAHDGGAAHDGRGGDRAAVASPADGTSPHYFNSAFLIDPNGTVVDRYDKVHLMPFAEYFPLRGIESLRRRFAQVRVFTPGAAVRPLATPDYQIGVVICFEAMYPELVSSAVGQGAQLLLNLTNDAWMGRSSFARQHLEIASLRAVESRRFLVRAASTGISAVIDPFGRTVAEIPAFEAGTLSVRVALLHESTFYTRAGDVFAVGCVLTALVALIAVRGASQRP